MLYLVDIEKNLFLIKETLKIEIYLQFLLYIKNKIV